MRKSHLGPTLFLLPILTVGSSTFLAKSVFAKSYTPCRMDSRRLKSRQLELQNLKAADQSDRIKNHKLTKKDWETLHFRDLERRKRVAEIFAEGCFSTAADYAAAALIFQHGDVPEHFFQTFLWSKEAVRLGDPSQKKLMAKGIDRYLVQNTIGHKQLFASQASRPNYDSCWCLQPVERSFPERKRKAYGVRTIAEALQWVNSMNQDLKQLDCKAPRECAVNLKPTPKGTIPGFW